ncbi:MAG TPA: alkaline phosphatase family protein [Acidimicrobiales bacterium]|nr:alkaline phosphatase family protein [Acidimicrobiales bacterium]
MAPPGAQELRHVIVLMLENRSFDHLLGFLDHPSSDLDGIPWPAGFGNPRDPDDPSKGETGTREQRRLRLRVDPDHSHAAVMEQLGLSRSGAAEPTNDGFVHSYEQKVTGKGPGAKKAKLAGEIAIAVTAVFGLAAVVALVAAQILLALAAGAVVLLGLSARARFVPVVDYFPGDGDRIMWCWSPQAIPALSTLARSFGLCTRWFCSVPGETWPNRQFAHAGTSAGTVDIEVRTYSDRTIFEVLEEEGHDWGIYYDGPAQVLCYPALWNRPERLARWHPIDDLYRDIASGDLPAYSFVEPNHGFIGRSYSQHPGNNRRLNTDFRRGDRFVAGVYEALRNNPALFAKTVLLVTFDEHGGTFDHVPPPKAVPPDDRREGSFDFTRYGPRVPAIVVSPWIPEASIDGRTLDHSSIPATLAAHFAPDADSLGRRATEAKTFLGLLTARSARTGDDLPDLSGRLWRARAARTPVDWLLGWIRVFGREEPDLHESLARLSAQVDQALPPVTEPGMVSPDAEALAGPLPPPPPTPRRVAGRAMIKLTAAATKARSADSHG